MPIPTATIRIDEPERATARMLRDPVCGVTVTPQSLHVLQHGGKPVYFCSARCEARFAADADAFVHAASDATVRVAATPPAVEERAFASQARQLVTHRFKLGDIMKAYDTFNQAADTKALRVIIEA